MIGTDPDQEQAGGRGCIRDNKNNPNRLSAYHVKLFTWIISSSYAQQPYKGGTIILAILWVRKLRFTGSYRLVQGHRNEYSWAGI